jgi:ketosteroid isomerase-like protein
MAAAISSRRSRGTFSASRVASALMRRTFWRPNNSRCVVRGAWCVAAMVVVSCSAPRVPLGDPQAEIGAMLARSAADWNHGDLAGFMGDYAKDSTTSYVSGSHVQYGWQPLFDHYQAAYFGPGKHRDSLSFDELHVRPLTTDLALATARFALHRGDSLTASGPFTLLLQKRGPRWQILHDHTSADAKP